MIAAPDIAIAVAFTIAVWWGSTGAVIYLDGLPETTFRWSFLGAAVLGVAGLWAIAATANDGSTAGAYTAFTGALAVWAWNEVAFLMGYITGPRPRSCPPDVTPSERFSYAIQAIGYHEVALAISGLVVWWVASAGTNTVAPLTFAILWAMRLSTKINIFLGVPNVAEELLPRGLRFLTSYFRKGPVNALFPATVTAATLLLAVLIWLVIDAATAAAAVGMTLLTTLMALAVLEHWLLVLPIRVERLWSWGMASHRANHDDIPARPIAGRPRDDITAITTTGAALAERPAPHDLGRIR
jgi:putative photosynthetic complex assembly protein 2